MNRHLKNFVIKPLKVLGWIIGSLIFLLLLITLSTRIPFVQNFIKDKAVSFYKDKTGTEASVGSLYVNFPSSVEVNELYIEDQAGDTLAYSGKIMVNTNLLDLLNNKLSLDNIYVRDLVGNIHNSDQDSTFNYQFIIDAFATSSPATADTTASAGFDFGLYGAEIEQARIQYMDLYAGMELKVDAGYLLAEASVFDLNNSVIYVENAQIQNSKGSFRITKESDSPEDTVSAPFYVNGKHAYVSDVDFTFEDIPGGIRVENKIGTVSMEADSINIVDQIYDARKISMLDTYVAVDLFGTASEQATDTAQADTDDEFSLLTSSEEIIMANVNFRFYDNSQAPAPEGFDPLHMWFQQVNLNAEEVQFQNGFASGRITRLSATENRGLVLREFSGEFDYQQQNASLENMSLVTARSRIRGDLEVTYPDLDALADSPGNIGLNLTFPESYLSLADVFYFVPSLESSLPGQVPADATIRWDGKLSGTVNDLRLNRFRASLFDNTRLLVDGNIKGIPDVNKLSAEIRDLDFVTVRSDYERILPDTLIPAGIHLPDTIELQGNMAGRAEDLNASVSLLTNLGDLRTDIRLQEKDSLYTYTGTLETDRVELGRIIENPDVGPVTLNLKVDGEGLTREELKSDVEGQINSFEYLGYTYDTLTLSANLSSDKFEGVVDLHDPNLTFDFNGAVGFSDSTNVYSFDLDLEKADLKNLNFSETEFQLIANVTSRISASSVDDINGYLLVRDTYLNKGDRIIPVDSLYFNATANEDSTSYHVFSDFLVADFTGTFKISQLPLVIEQHISKYYELDNTDSVYLTELRPQTFDMNIDIKNPAVFTQLLPDLTELQVNEINGHYDSEDWEIMLNIQAPRVVYRGLEADSLFLTMDSDEFAFRFETGARQFVTGPARITNILLEGDIESDNIMTSLHILDEEQEDKYLFGGIFISLEDHYRFMFTPGKFITNYEPWELKPSNSIDIYPNELWVENLFLENSGQEIKLYSEVNQHQDSALHVDFSGVRLEEFGNITQDSVAIISGVIQGESSFNMISTGLAFTSDLSIDQFSYRGDTLGNISINGDTDDGQLYTMDLHVKGNENDIELSGTYDADSAGEVNMQLAVNRLALETTEAFAAGQVNDLQGDVRGNINITGQANRPDIDGTLNFEAVRFRPTYVGSLITIDGQELRVNNTGLQFSNFTLTDEQGDKAILDGSISTDDFLVYDLDLDLKARAFKIINRPLPTGIPRGESPFYGNLDVTSDISLRGTSIQPVIDVKASFADGSTFAYVIPEETLTEEEQKDVVEWFDKDLEEISFFNDEASQKNDSIKNILQGINLNAELTVTPQNELSIVIDPQTGDRLTIKGNAALNFGIDQSGSQTLTGRFEVTEGSYLLNFYSIVRREFSIQEGSYILWTGDPLNAVMNVTAVYEVRAAAPPGLGAASGKLPYLVFLDIGGQLIQPEISFRLGLAPDAPAPIQIEAWVNQQNTQAERVNRQVFGLLLFQSFFPEDSYASASNVNFVENTARSSVSRILSSQLNRLSDQIKGVDLTIDLDSYQDYTSEDGAYGRTELELGVSKELFNERVVVKLAGNVDLEGNRSRQGVSNFAGDIQIEYKLTEDGRFRLLGFRNNDFDNIQGEIIRTGVGVIYVREYNAFRELFKKSQEAEAEE